MKLAPNGIDVREGKGMIVCTVGQQNENALARRIDPATGARESGVPKRIGRQTRAGRRIFRGGELPTKRARFVEAGRQVLAKQLRCFFR